MGDRFVRHVRPELTDPTLVLAFEGWNDAGEAASLACRYVSEQIGTAPLAEFASDEFHDLTVERPRVRIDAEGVRSIEWPAVKLRFGSLADGRDLVLGGGPEPHLRWRTFSQALVAYVREIGVARVVLLGAYLADVVYSRPVQVSGFATSPEDMKQLGVSPSHYEGPTGIVGVLGESLSEAGCEVLSLWAGLPHYINATPNPRGALALVQKLVPALGLKLDEGPLRRQAAEFEQRISELVASDPELAEYVRQLKRREFAQ